MILSFSAVASYNGDVTFSQGEIDFHKKKIRKLIDTSMNCLENYKVEHQNFFDSHCIIDANGEKKCLSKFYGERRYTKIKGSRRADGKLLEFLPEALEEEGFDPALVNEMEAMSCVGLALQCLKEGFSQTGQTSQWNNIMNFVRANGVGGTALQHALQQIGWRVYFWNPVPLDRIIEETGKWDKEEKNWASKGYHQYRYYTVRNSNRYWNNQVDVPYELVGFESTIPSLIFQYPFWIGTANTGYHVFPGTFENVVEAHSTRKFTSFDNFEFSDFNPMAKGGGPRWTRTEKYRSGLIALPPL